MKNLKELEKLNDKALVTYWKAVMASDQCRQALNASREAIAFRLAEEERDKAQEVMTKARLEYLLAKVKVAQ